MKPSDIRVKKISHFTGHKAGVYCIANSSQEGSFLTAGGDGIIAEWNYLIAETAVAIAQVPGKIFSLLNITERNTLIAGDMYGGVYLIDTNSKLALKNLAQNNASVYDLQYQSKQKKLLGACGDGFVRIWNLENNDLIRAIQLTDKSIRNIAVSPDGKMISFSCSDHNIYLTDENFNIRQVLNGHTNSVFCSVFSPYGKYLISGSRDATLRVWDLENNCSLAQTIQAHMFTINDIKFNPAGTLFATAGRDKHIKIWDSATLNLLKVIDFEKFGGHINSVNKLFWSHSDNYLISCGDDLAVMVWEISY